MPPASGVGLAHAAPGGPADAIDGVPPGALVEPDTVEGLRSAVEAAAAGGRTVAPVGGRTRLDVGNPPRSIDLMLSTRRADRLTRHTPDDLTATAEAGITIARLQDALAAYGQYLAVDPPLPDRATLGGTLAVGFSGPARWMYGNVRDCVIGMSVIQADGKLTKSGGQVVKNVSGYDLARMHVGALGTLGVIAEVSLKLTPLPRSESTLLAGFDSTAAAWRAGLDVFRSAVTPLALTVFDEHARGLLDAPDGGRAAYLAVRLGGRPRTVERQARECRALAARPDALDAASASALWRGLRDFGWGGEPGPRLLLRAMAAPADGIGAIDALPRGASPAVVGHPAHGVIGACWPGDTDAPPASAPPADALLDARRAVEALGGRLVIERRPAGMKWEIDAWGEIGASLGTMRRLKKEFDPAGIFNPGRYVGGI